MTYLMIGEYVLVELSFAHLRNPVEQGQYFCIDLHVADEFKEENKAECSEGDARDRIFVEVFPAVEDNIDKEGNLVYFQQ